MIVALRAQKRLLIVEGAEQLVAQVAALNCASLPEHLAESELFGYERGAFTGAILARPELIVAEHLELIPLLK